MGRKILARLARIARDRRFQGVQIFELLLFAQLFQEAHAKMLSVKVLLIVEEMYFEQRDGDRVDGGPLSQARHAPPEIVHFHHKDARKRGRAAKHYVRGREAEAAAELRAVRHAPADGVRVAEQALRLAKLP